MNSRMEEMGKESMKMIAERYKLPNLNNREKLGLKKMNISLKTYETIRCNKSQN